MVDTGLAGLPTRGRRVGSADIAFADRSSAADGIGELYRGAVDVIVARGAFADPRWADAGARLDADAETFDWARPNVRMPVEDIRILGTDTPATPTFRSPRGASLDEYLGSAASQSASAIAGLGPELDPVAAVRGALARFAGGLPVEQARAADGRPYVPFTVRRLVDGTQIGVHHDYHYPLELYRDLAPQLDTATLLSYVVTLQAPQEGGALRVYGATSDMTDLPRLPNGFAYDLPALEAGYPHVRLEMAAGDLFLLAAGRCLHRVEMVRGPRARITLGGFMALDRSRERLLFWS